MKMSYENESDSVHGWILVVTCECGVVTRLPFESLVQGMSVACECGEKGILDDITGLRDEFGLKD